MIDLSGHAALITGSTRGVGRSIAEAFARAGARLVLHGLLDGETAQEAVAACRQAGSEVALVTGDLATGNDAAIDGLFEQALAAIPEIDVLVNNAGLFIDTPYLEMDRDRWQRTMDLNVAAPYFLTQRFAQRWIERGVDGRVLMTGSINGRLAEEGHTAYDTSKGAVEAMVKTLCVALAPYGIRVNGMAPGLVRTPLTSIIDENARFRRWMELHTPNRQVPHSDVCGPAAVFLCSDAAWHVHGQMLLVDGGMSTWQQPEVPEEYRP